MIMRARTWDHALIAQLMRAFASVPQVVEAFKDMNYLDNAMDLEGTTIGTSQYLFTEASLQT